MLVRNVPNCPQFVAGDHTLLREVYHPAKEQVSLGYSLAWAMLPAGDVSLPHRLAGSEVYYILSGTGTMHVDNEQCDIGPGSAIYVPPGASQYVANTGVGDLVFLCIVDPAWRAEDEEVFQLT